jgi:hypothetical protein
VKTILTLQHPDTVSGTSIFDDGTKVYWTEGRSSDVAILTAEGKRYRVGPWDVGEHADPYYDYLSQADDAYACPGREMTLGERFEHELERNGGCD